jgi:hypothetical protein
MATIEMRKKSVSKIALSPAINGDKTGFFRLLCHLCDNLVAFL